LNFLSNKPCAVIAGQQGGGGRGERGAQVDFCKY
jgi:hypothetical protein